MRRARIVHVFSTFDPGGPQVRAVSVMAAMPECEHVVIPMDARAGAAALFPAGLDARVLLPPSGRKKLLYGLTMRRWLAALAPDLMVTQNWGAIDALIGSRLHPFFPVVHMEDGFLPDEAAARKWRRRLARFVVLNTIEATVVPSRTLERIARREYGIAASRVRFIANGVDLARFRPRRDPAWRRALGVPDRALLVGSLGHLRPEKDLGVLLRAFAAGAPADAWLAIAGGGPERAALEALADRLGVSRRVVFAGPAARPEAAYAAFDVFAMSSMTEQMPIALLEAMASGLACIATDVGDCRAMLGDAQGVVVPAGDVAGMAEALRRVCGDERRRAALGAENRNRAVLDFDRVGMIEAWTSLFRGAMQRKRTRTRTRARARTTHDASRIRDDGFGERARSG